MPAMTNITGRTELSKLFIDNSTGSLAGKSLTRRVVPLLGYPKPFAAEGFLECWDLGVEAVRLIKG